MTTLEPRAPMDIFLGVGGHGSVASFGDYIFSRNHWNHKDKPNYTLNRKAVIVSAGIDSGGSTGTQLDLLKLNHHELNEQLHGSRDFPFQAYGDLKHFLNKSLTIHVNEKDWGQILDRRSNHASELLQSFDALDDTLHLSQKLPTLRSEFAEYLAIYFQYFGQYQHLLHPERIKKACFSNLFLAFIHGKTKTIRGFNKWLQTYEFIPDWVEFHFFSKANVNLHGRDFYGSPIEYEDTFDSWPYPIEPKSYKILDEEGKAAQVNPILVTYLENLQDSDNIFITPGSDSNWLGILNHSKIKQLIAKISQEGRLNWIANLFHFTSEVPIILTAKYLSSVDITPNIYVPNEQFVKSLLHPKNFNILKAYIVGQGKVPNIFYLPHFRPLVAELVDILDQEIKEQKKDCLGLIRNILKANTSLDLITSQNIHYNIKANLVGKSFTHDADNIFGLFR
jgi:hypothetical protein